MTYIDRLELMAFFAGYPFVYAIIQVIHGTGKKSTPVLRDLVTILPLAYALSGTLFAGMVVKELYPYAHSWTNIINQFYSPFLKIWGMMAVLFWVPALNRRPVLSLLHSLVFFFFLVHDIYIQFTSFPAKEIIQNDMKIFTDSLLLNSICLFLVALIYYPLARRRRLKS